MAATAPEHTALEEAAEAIRRKGVAGAFQTLAEVGWQRLRAGELGSLPVIVALAVIWTFFQAKQDVFLSATNLSNLSVQIGVTGTIAIGIVLVLLLGEIDLSVGAVALLCSALIGWSTFNHSWAWYWAIAFALAAGAAIGALQGGWFAIIGVPSFVVTLAGLLGWQGVQLKVLGVNGTINVFEPHLTAVADTHLPRTWGWAVGIVAAGLYALSRFWASARRRRAGLPAAPIVVVVVRTVVVAAISLLAVAILNGTLNSFWFFGNNPLAPGNRGVPTTALILLGLTIFFAWLTTRTKFGRYVYAVGGNAEAARRAGVNVAAIRIVVFSLAGFLAGIGGLIQTARLNAASQAIQPGQVTLEVIAAAVIGGTSLFGGRGTVWAALLGALVIGSVGNGLDLIGQSPAVKLIVEGGILLLAITVDAIARRGRAAAGRV
jgi:D-xylose transport system permease protein